MISPPLQRLLKSSDEVWPRLPLSVWNDTYATLHMWCQIVGKVRLKLSPFVNHWWGVTLYVSSRGLTTSPIPDQNRTFEIKFDFIDHILKIETSDNSVRTLALEAKSVAEFYRELMDLLHSLDIHVKINLLPQEVPHPIPFDQDRTHASYDAASVHRFWCILVQADRVMKEFRSGFIGKCSPVHFFWGSFDLAVTRFSGRLAPPRLGADQVTQEAYSHEVLSCGFWPGSGNIQGPAFYAYVSPEPQGYSKSLIRPTSAFYNSTTRGFILMYDEVRRSVDPDQMILDFFQSTYDAGANLGKWNRLQLERIHPAQKRAA